MKRIKISEQQANMLQELGKTKILKVTKEQYNKIIESERLVEGVGPSDVDNSFNKLFNGAAKNEFNNTKIKLEELYEKFINELYGVNESSELVYEKLHKLMEVAGLINNGRLVKEKFKGDKNIVKEIISMGLHEMYEGGNEYNAMNTMEEALDADLSNSHENREDTFKTIFDKNVDIKKVTNNTIKLYYENGKYKEAWRFYQTLGQDALREEEVENPKGIVGLDILKYPPVSQLRKKALDEPTSVKKVRFPGLGRLDATRDIISHENIEDTWHEYLRVDNKWVPGYVTVFKNMYGELPIFKITPENKFLDVDILNPKYVKARDEFIQGMANAAKEDPDMFKHEQDVDETDSYSSGQYGGTNFLGEPMNQEGSNVVDELISDDVEIETLTSFRESVAGILKIINSASVDPNTIVKNKEELIKLAASVVNHDNKEDNVINKTLPSLKRKFPKMIDTLIQYADNAHDVEVFKKYPEFIKGVYNILVYINKHLKHNKSIEINEEGVQNSGQYDVQSFVKPSMKGDTPKGTGPTWKKPTIAGGKKVEVKEKCSKSPYCNQGPDAIEISK